MTEILNQYLQNVLESPDWYGLLHGARVIGVLDGVSSNKKSEVCGLKLKKGKKCYWIDVKKIKECEE